MKVAVITGGSSGIGEACIDKFIDNEYYIFNFDINSNSKFNKYNNYNFIKIDLRNELEIAKAMSDIILLMKRLDVLILSAGKHLSATIENTSTYELQDIINLNLSSVFWLIKYAIPYMKTQNHGNIITIGSDQCSIAKYNSAAYGMSKAAIAHLTKSTALDYAKYNIRTNCICAGTIDTPLYRSAVERYSTESGISIEEINNCEGQQQPIGRIGLASEVAELAFFLTNDKASYITGALLPMDGGYTIK